MTAMLRPEDTSVGSLRDATELTLLMPRGDGEQTMLIVPTVDGLHAVFLDGPYAFNAFPCGENEAWSGLLVTGIRLELDPDSLFNPNQGTTPLGALVRHADQLTLAVSMKDRRGLFSPAAR